MKIVLSLFSLLSFSFIGVAHADTSSRIGVRSYQPLMAKAVRIETAAIVKPKANATKTAIRDGWKHFDAAEWEKAMDSFLKALESEPSSHEAAEGLTMTVYRSGDKKSAAQLGEEFADTIPSIRKMVAEAMLADAKMDIENGGLEAVREVVKVLPYGDGAYDSVRDLVEIALVDRLDSQKGSLAKRVE